jgi:hypothetical protein
VEIVTNRKRYFAGELALKSAEKLISDLEVSLVEELYKLSLCQWIVKLKINGLMTLIQHFKDFLCKKQLTMPHLSKHLLLSNLLSHSKHHLPTLALQTVLIGKPNHLHYEQPHLVSDL